MGKSEEPFHCSTEFHCEQNDLSGRIHPYPSSVFRPLPHMIHRLQLKRLPLTTTANQYLCHSRNFVILVNLISEYHLPLSIKGVEFFNLSLVKAGTTVIFLMN